MAGPYTGAGKARLVQPGDPVASSVVDQPIAVILKRLAALEALIQAEEATTLQAITIYNVPIDGTVNLNDAVYYNPNTGVYSQAIATVSLINNTFTANPTALAQGFAFEINGTTANIQVGGTAVWSSSTQAQSMMQSGETFQAGAPYYLSATQAGKLTRFPPMMRVLMMQTSNTNFIVIPTPSIPEAIENIYTNPIGMRPVGGIRALPPDYTKNIIVGFDALEYVNAVTEWRPTSQNPNAILQNFGYMVADASITTLPVTPPIYIEIDIAVNGTITAFSAGTLANLFLGGPATFNQLNLTTINSSNYSNVQSYAVLDLDGASLGTLSFKFTTLDLAYPRRVVFKFPDSFQGWKMIYAPVSPLATPNITSGVIQSITMQEHSVGFVTAPSVTAVDTGGGNGAVLTANLDVYGGVTSISVVNGGTGYSSATVIVFNSSVSSVSINGGGDGATVALTVGINGLINGANVVTPGSNYGTPPSIVVTDSGTGTGAVLQAVLQNGQLSQVNIVNGGSGYTQGSTTTPTAIVVPSSFGYMTTPTLITTSGNPLTPAVVALNLGTKRIQCIQIVCAGIGYTANATLLLSDSGTGTPSPSAVIAAYTDANGSIYKLSILNPGGYTTTPTLTAPGSGVGAQFAVTLAASIASATVSNPGSGYQTPTTFQIGASLAAINIAETGTGYQPTLAPTVTISAPDDTIHGVQAVGTAVLGGYVARVNVITAGSLYANPANVTVVVTNPTTGGSGATFSPIIQNGALLSVEITSPGNNYLVPPVLTIHDSSGSPGSGAVVNCEIEAAGGVVGITLSNPGNGYVNPPSVTLSGPVDSSGNPINGGCTAQAFAVLAAGPAEAVALLSGMGGSRLTQTTMATQGNNLQVFDFHDDLDQPGAPFPEPQSSSILYYNIKADPLLQLRYPPNPIEKVQAIWNGVELLTGVYNTATGAYADMDTDVGITTETPFWTTFDLDGSPWDRNWLQYVFGCNLTGNDAIIQNSGPVGQPANWWRFWENVYLYSTSRNKGWLHINKASLFAQTNKITSLGCLAPLRLIDVASGVESANDGSAMVGQLLMVVDAMDNFIGGTGVQINMTQAGNTQAIYTNNTGTAVIVTSVIMYVVFQSVSGTGSPTSNTAQITIGTAAGNYSDYLGSSSATVANTWLSAVNQFHEFVPDPQIGAPVLQPGLSLYVNVVQPAGAPITAQFTVCKVKGIVL